MFCVRVADNGSGMGRSAKLPLCGGGRASHHGGVRPCPFVIRREAVKGVAAAINS